MGLVSAGVVFEEVYLLPGWEIVGMPLGGVGLLCPGPLSCGTPDFWCFQTLSGHLCYVESLESFQLDFCLLLMGYRTGGPRLTATNEHEISGRCSASFAPAVNTAVKQNCSREVNLAFSIDSACRKPDGKVRNGHRTTNTGVLRPS